MQIDNFLTFTVNRMGKHVSIMHCDADTVELGDKITRYLNKKGIDRHVSTPFTPHQNGLVERAMQRVLDKTRTLLYTGRVPKKYWDYALLYASKLLNCTTNVKTSVTPIQMLTGDPPDISNFVPFFLSWCLS